MSEANTAKTSLCALLVQLYKFLLRFALGPLVGGGGTISSIFLNIGVRLDAQLFLEVVLLDKKGNVFNKLTKLNFCPPYQGLKKRTPLFDGKK